MQTPRLLILLGWTSRTRLYPPILSRLSGVVESMYVSDKHMKSGLYIEIYTFNCVSTSKLKPGGLLTPIWTHS